MNGQELRILITADAASAEAAMTRVAGAVRKLDPVIAGTARSMGQARAETSNLAAQFQDIGVMLAAGQSPLLLALQQGTQISAVLGNMGAAGAAKALGGALRSLVSPVSLLTIGVIAGGAALFQWATGAGEAEEEAQTFEERVRGVVEALKAYQQNATMAGRSTEQLRAEFGDFADDALRLIEIMARSSLAEGFAALETSMDPIQAQLDEAVAKAREAEEAFRRVLEMSATGESPQVWADMLNSVEIFMSSADRAVASLGLTADQAGELARHLNQVEQAQTMQELRDAADEAVDFISSIYENALEMPEPLRKAQESLAGMSLQAGRAVISEENFSEPLRQGAIDAERIASALSEAGATTLTHPRFGSIVADRATNNLGGLREATDGGILDLIGYAEGTDRGRGYNETLGYGAFTGGPVDLINMTLAEVRELQRAMLAHPDNHFNSSAVGRYQIVGNTLDSLVGNMGLDWNQQFTPDLQDRMALQLVRGRDGQGLPGMRNEWEGLRNVPDAAITQALGGQVIPAMDPEMAAAAEQQAQLSAEAQRVLAQSVEATRSAYDSLAASLDPAIAAQQALAEGTRVADNALAAGVISIEEHASMVASLGGQYEATMAQIAEATEAPSQAMLDFADTFGDAVAGVIVEGEDLRENMRRILAQIASNAISSGVSGLLTSIFGGGGGLFGGGAPAFAVAPAANIARIPSGGMGGALAAAKAVNNRMTIRIEEAPEFAARVRAEADGVAVERVRAYDRQMPSRVRGIQADPRAR